LSDAAAASLGGVELSVGALSADVLRLGEDVRRLEDAGVQALHFDVMDGRFCPDFTVGTWLVAAIHTSLVKDVHLMVADPENWVESSVAAGAGIVTVHLEAGTHVHRALELVSESAQRQGLAQPMRGLGLCPGTAVADVEPFLDVVDIVYVLGINPGWRQPMLASTADRVRAVRDLTSAGDRPIQVAVDGGVSLANFADVVSLGPDLVVSGSAVFADGDVEANLATLASAGARLVAPQD
jgi:ribulose-phosphate 3-epimerase